MWKYAVPCCRVCVGIKKGIVKFFGSGAERVFLFCLYYSVIFALVSVMWMSNERRGDEQEDSGFFLLF